MSDFRYAVEIRWSEDDDRYLAFVSELPGCVADGKTAEEACKNAVEMAGEWLQTARRIRRAIPVSRENDRTGT